MNFDFDGDEYALRESAERLLRSRVDLSHLVNHGLRPDTSYDDSLWKIMVDAGWTGLIVPEEYGGSGATFVTWVVLTEELGRALAQTPYLGHYAGTVALLVAGTEEQKKYLQSATAGASQLSLAWLEGRGADDIPATVRNGKLSGRKRHVIDGHGATQFVVTARDAAGGQGLYFVDANQPGVEKEDVDWMDLTRPLSHVTFDGADAELLTGGDGFDQDWAAIEDRMILAVASESIGGAEAVLTTSVEYAKNRIAYGRPIGSYQAIKHKCADMAVLVEGGKSLTYYLAWALTSGDRSTQRLASAMAASWCGDAFRRCTAEAIQIHGAVGFTWELNLHLFYKRARANVALFGRPSEHRDRVVELVGSGTTGVL